MMADQAQASVPAEELSAKEEKARRRQRMKEMKEQKLKEINEERLEAQKKREAKLAGDLASDDDAAAAAATPGAELSKEQELALIQERLKQLEMQSTLEKAVPGKTASELMNGAANAEFEDREVTFAEERWGMNARLTGGPVVITSVKEGGEGDRNGVLVGDVIYRIGGVSVDTDREEAIALIRKGGATTVHFKRLSTRQPVSVGTGDQAQSVFKGEDMSAGEVKRLQAMLGGAKAKDTVAHTGQRDVTIDLGEDSGLTPTSTLVIGNCHNSTFTVQTRCAKVFVQGCTNLTVRLLDRILTATIETYKCEDLNMHVETKCGTIQADMCKNININFPKQEYFTDQSKKTGKNTSMIVWAGCHNLQLRVEDVDHSLVTGFEQMKLEYADLVEERSQFRIKYEANTSGGFDLHQTKIIRLENGFFTTQTEKNDFDRKQEANMQQMAKAMGITVQKAKPKGIKCKPNDMCPQGSGKKFKKCCNRTDGYCDGSAAPKNEW